MVQLMMFINLMIAVLNVFSLTFLYNALFERRLQKSAYWICLLGTIPLLWICLMLIPMGTSLVRVASHLAIDFLILSLFRGRLLVRLCICSLFFLIACSFETILLPAILTFRNISFHQLWQDPQAIAAVHLIPMAGLFICCQFLARIFRKWKNQIELPALEWLAIFLFAVFTFFELYFAELLVGADSTFIPLLPILGGVLLFMNVALLLLLNRLASHHWMERENIALQEQMRYSCQSMQAAAESYSIQRSLTHDFDNHLLTITQLLQCGQCEEALTYAQTIMSNLSKADVAVSTNNPIADAVLNQKYRKARKLGIWMQFLVSDLSSFPLSTDEMVTVLANLLDNALEACMQVSSTKKKSIRVKLLIEPTLATISVQNTSLPVVISQNGDIATTKNQQSEHGYGMKNCRKILQRSGFDFAAQYKNGWFQFTAIKAL